MPFITQGKTNWKLLLIVIILAVIVGGGALIYLQFVQKKGSETLLSLEQSVEKPKEGFEIFKDDDFFIYYSLDWKDATKPNKYEKSIFYKEKEYSNNSCRFIINKSARIDLESIKNDMDSLLVDNAQIHLDKNNIIKNSQGEKYVLVLEEEGGEKNTKHKIWGSYFNCGKFTYQGGIECFMFNLNIGTEEEANQIFDYISDSMSCKTKIGITEEEKKKNIKEWERQARENKDVLGTYIISNMSDISIEAETYNMNNNYSYSGFSCDATDNMKVICNDIKGYAGMYEDMQPIIRAKKEAYCVYIQFPKGDYYCIYSRFKRIRTDIDPGGMSYCNGETFVCPPEKK